MVDLFSDTGRLVIKLTFSELLFRILGRNCLLVLQFLDGLANQKFVD